MRERSGTVPEARSNTLLFTSYNPKWSDLARLTCKTHFEYAKKHGYDYAADCSDYQDKVWPQGHSMGIRGFIKFDLLLHYFDRYKYLCWIDADCLITNPEIPLENFRSHGVTMGYDHNGIHSTVFMAHATPLVYDFFWACNNTGRKFFLAHDWHEMESMRYFSQTAPYKDLLHYVSAKELCPILGPEYEPFGLPQRVSGKYSWEPGDFACHLSALALEKRIELAQRVLEQIGQ